MNALDPQKPLQQRRSPNCVKRRRNLRTRIHPSNAVGGGPGRTLRLWLGMLRKVRSFGIHFYHLFKVGQKFNLQPKMFMWT